MPVSDMNSLEDVARFAEKLKAELGLGFHCDDNFEDYIYFDSGESIYTKDEAAIRNEMITEAFSICKKSGVDIYSFMGRTIVKNTPFANVFD